MKYQTPNKRTSRIEPGDEIGGTRIVWCTKFYDKAGQFIGLYIGIDKKARYCLYISDSSNVLNRIRNRSEDIKTLILESIKITKQRCRLNHPGFNMRDKNLPEGR